VSAEDVDTLVAEHVAAGRHVDAAKVLSTAGRHAEAGKLLLDSVGGNADRVGDLEGAARSKAVRAARMFDLGGDADTAARIRRALGLEVSSDVPATASRTSGQGPPVAPRARIGSVNGVSPVGGARGATPVPPQDAPASRTSEPRAAPVAATPAPPPRASEPRAAPVASTPAPPEPPAHASEPRLTPVVPADPADVARTSVPKAAPVAVLEPPPEAAPPPKPPTPAPPRPERPRTKAPPSAEKHGRAAGWRTGVVDGGAQDEAIRQLAAAGKTAAAARLAWDKGMLEQALAWFAEAGMAYVTGAVLFDMGRHDEARERLLAVPTDHKRYRVACGKLVDICAHLGQIDFDVDRAFVNLAKVPPVEASEVATYLALADLYVAHSFGESARRVLETVLAFDPGHEDAASRLAAIPVTVVRTSEPAARRRSFAPAPEGTRGLPPLPSVDEYVALLRSRA
jgi:hypothetical protein